LAKKKKKNRARIRRHPSKDPLDKIGRGFDFGLQPRVMAMPDMEFNQALRDAGIIGCAYGSHPMEGMPDPVPSITLVGTDSAAFTKAYQHFVHWGCEEDGDVVDVDLLLKSDGSYDLWIGPEIKRSIYRTIPQSALFDTMSMNISWIKHIDSTNEMVYDLRQYCQSGRLSPIVIMAATSTKKNIRSMQIEPVPSWKGILKFGLRILTEAEASLDPIYSFIASRSNQKKSPTPPKIIPKDLCQNRIMTLNTAFPVSRERILRSSLFDEVRGMNGFESVTEIQVIQAAINLMLSNELISGDKHYRQVTGDYYKKIWDAIAVRSDMADGSSQLADLDPVVIAHQVELDVRATLSKMKRRSAREPFSKLQEVFKQKGLVND